MASAFTSVFLYLIDLYLESKTRDDTPASRSSTRAELFCVRGRTCSAEAQTNVTSFSVALLPPCPLRSATTCLPQLADESKQRRLEQQNNCHPSVENHIWRLCVCLCLCVRVRTHAMGINTPYGSLFLSVPVHVHGHTHHSEIMTTYLVFSFCFESQCDAPYCVVTSRVFYLIFLMLSLV